MGFLVYQVKETKNMVRYECAGDPEEAPLGALYIPKVTLRAIQSAQHPAVDMPTINEWAYPTTLEITVQQVEVHVGSGDGS